MTTPLDTAREKVGEDGNMTPYLMALGQANLFVVMDPDFVDKMDGEINPAIMMLDEKPFILVFDTQARFEEWAYEFEEDLPYKEISGSLFFDWLEPLEDLHIFVNPNTEVEEIIYPDNILWLKQKLFEQDMEALHPGAAFLEMSAYTPEGDLKALLDKIIKHDASITAVYCNTINNDEHETITVFFDFQNPDNMDAKISDLQEIFDDNTDLSVIAFSLENMNQEIANSIKTKQKPFFGKAVH